MSRKPAVAGTFYPANQVELKKSVDSFLAQNKKTIPEGKMLKALIVPHAGYVYSGAVAAAGFSLLEGKEYSNILLLGPTHYVAFNGAAIATEDFETPLGLIKVGKTKKWIDDRLIKDLKLTHLNEHCLEVQLPFLQQVLKEFKLYALLLGEIKAEELAEKIVKYLDDDTLIIVSSDLSHYLSYDAAIKKDQATINHILNFNFFGEIEACGNKPIRVLMHLAKKLGWQPFLIDYKNSGDTAGD